MSGSPKPAALLLVAAALASAGCFQEQLPEREIDGELVLRGEFVDDPRTAGMIFIGVYESVDPEQLGYPYPSTAPRVGDNPIGDALPYGGTSVGDYAYACYRSLQCKVINGRHDTLDSILDAFPLTDEAGELVDSEQMYDQCTWYYGWNSIEEFTFLTDELDFREEGGDWVAEFRMWHTSAPAGSVMWGFADRDRTSCSVDAGPVNRRRGDDGVYFREGSNFADVLNFPDKYISDGDILSEVPEPIVADKDEGYRLVLDYLKD
jgi:hypothetical protein